MGPRADHPFTFRDAIGVAFELADRHEAATVALLDPDRPDPPVATAPGPASRSMLPALSRLLANARAPSTGGEHTDPATSLLVTVERERLLLAPADLVLYRWAWLALAEVGVSLLDWIHTDSELIRSAAFTDSPRRAWRNDPPHHRLLDQLTVVWARSPPHPARACDDRTST